MCFCSLLWCDDLIEVVYQVLYGLIYVSSEKRRLPICGYSSFILHQNLTNGSFLNVVYNMESETISINFSDYWIQIHSSKTLNGSLLIRDFETLFISHLENHCLLSYAVLPTVDTFSNIIQRSAV